MFFDAAELTKSKIQKMFGVSRIDKHQCSTFFPQTVELF